MECSRSQQSREGDELLVTYKGFLADGTVFDSNEGKDPIRLVGIAETKTNTSKKKDVKKRRLYKMLTQTKTTNLKF